MTQIASNNYDTYAYVWLRFDCRESGVDQHTKIE
jgi:hypothetical protein